MGIENSLKYNKAINKSLIKAASPLLDFGISTFAHFQFFKDGSTYRISTDLGWSDVYFNNNFHTHPNGYHKDIRQSCQTHDLHYCLWTRDPSNEIYAALKDNNIWNGITICERTDDALVGWSFGSTVQNEGVIDFYVSNLNLLKHFILYFKSTSPELVSTKDSNKLYKISNGIDLAAEANEIRCIIYDFFSKTNITRYNVDSDKGLYFSKREFECLYHLSMGKCTKQVGHTLNISKRTVESHMINMKLRFGVNSKFDLIAIFMDKVFKWV